MAGIGFTLGRTGRASEDQLSDLVVDSIAAVARTSERGRLIALVVGGFATLAAAGGVVEVRRWIHLLAWRLAHADSAAPRGWWSGWSPAWRWCLAPRQVRSGRGRPPPAWPTSSPYW